MLNKARIAKILSAILLAGSTLPALQVTAQETLATEETSQPLEESTELSTDEPVENTEDETVTEESTTEEISPVEEPLMSSGPLDMRTQPILTTPSEFPEKFTYDDGVNIPYPEDGVKGIYVTGHSAAGEQMDHLTDMVNNTALNAMVIDVKDDWGNILFDLPTDNELVQENTMSYMPAEDLIGHMEDNQIYPIARIVVFKDSLLSELRPDLSFTQADGSVWKAPNGEGFVNPFQKEVWEYNVEIAKEAAKLGFKEIQFDYVRFPEGFEVFGEELQYDMGDYAQAEDPVQQRVAAVSDFVEYASNELKPYGVDVSVDIFGYTATIPEAPGIGQNFTKIAENVDVISSMIYPSHWGPGHFDLPAPDLEPYLLTDRYIELELEVLSQLEDPPITRPWLQDFTASYLGAGNYKEYGVEEVEAQIQALYDHGVTEYLLWDASNNYTQGVNFAPDSKSTPTAESEDSSDQESSTSEQINPE